MIHAPRGLCADRLCFLMIKCVFVVYNNDVAFSRKIATIAFLEFHPNIHQGDGIFLINIISLVSMFASLKNLYLNVFIL
jgi:hypothetical protein